MKDGIVFFFIWAFFITIFIICGLILNKKKLWPKILVLTFAIALLSVAGFFCISIINITDANIYAEVISVQYTDDFYYKVECEYTYRNKTYRAFVERNFYEKPEVGSTISVMVTIEKPDEINIYYGDESGDGLMIVFLIFGILISGTTGVIILIPSIININRFIKSNKTPKKDNYSDKWF